MGKTTSKKVVKPKAKTKPKRTAKVRAPRKVTREPVNTLFETPVAPWQFLVRRLHPWRKQLYVKGRNLTARQLVGSIKSNQFDEEKASQNHHLPIGAVREALTYVEQNREFLETEAEIERLMGKREGAARAAQPLP